MLLKNRGESNTVLSINEFMSYIYKVTTFRIFAIHQSIRNSTSNQNVNIVDVYLGCCLVKLKHF